MAAKPTSSATPPPPAQKRPAPNVPQEKRVQQILSDPIQLSDQINQTVKEAKIFKFECSEVGKRAARMLHLLRSAVRLSTSVSSFYDRPLLHVAAAASPNLQKSLTLVRKCRRSGLFRRLFTIISAAEFRKLISLLDSSAADMDWVIGILEAGGDGPTLTLPPIASTDPIISWVWSFVASLHTARSQEKSEAANQLASLAKDNDRNKQIILEEGGVSPLLKMLKDSSYLDGQIAAALALCSLAKNEESVRAIIDAPGVSVIVQVLSNSSYEVQIRVGNLVAKMAEHCPLAKEDFARLNVIRPLVMLLSFGVPMDDSDKLKFRKESICFIVHKEMEMNNFNQSGFVSSNLSSHYKERGIEDPQARLALQTSCARALRMLAKNSVVNSRRITETKGLLCLARLVGTQKGELQYNCLMTIMEIAATAESDADLKRAAFKTNSVASKAAINQLLRVVKDSDDEDPRLTIAAIKAVGCLSRTFPSRETTKITIIGPLVERLRDENQNVAIEAAISLGKFACPENFLCVEHSMSIIECGGVLPLVGLSRGDERGQAHGMTLICYLAIHAAKSDDLDRARMIGVLEGVDRGIIARHPKLRELVSKAIYHLSVFHQSGVLAPTGL